MDSKTVVILLLGAIVGYVILHRMATPAPPVAQQEPITTVI